MGLRGPKPKWRTFVWSPNVAYAVGLFATDGCLYKDGRHLNLVSMDTEQLRHFTLCLNLNVQITFKSRKKNDTRCPQLQFSDVALYQFFVRIGLTPAKSKTLSTLAIPKRYFFDFLRGVMDGDGSFYSYYDPRWRSSFMYYLILASASKSFIDWIRLELNQRLGVVGHVTLQRSKSTYQLKYAKQESLKIIKKMYYSRTVVCLKRKRLKIERALREAIKTRAGGET